MSTQSFEEQYAEINETNEKMTGLQAVVKSKAGAAARFEKKLEKAREELALAEKEVNDFVPIHKAASRKLVTLMNSMPDRSSEIMSAALKAIKSEAGKS